MSKAATQFTPKVNPFALDMKTMQAPKDCGDTMSVGGFDIELDENRQVQVPSKFVPDLKAHGFKPVAG